MKEDIILDRYERYAEHNQDHEFFENLAENMKLSDEDAQTLKDIQDNLQPGEPKEDDEVTIEESL